MKKSIFFKIFAGYLIITLLLSTLILLFSFRTIRSYYLETLQNDLQNIATALEVAIKPYLAQQRFDALDNLVKRLGNDINTRITVINPAGVVLADSEEDPESMENHRTRPEIMKALKGIAGSSLRYSTTVKQEMLYVAIPLLERGKIIGTIRTSLFLKNIKGLLAALRFSILQIAFIILIISLAGAAIFAHTLTRPVKVLTAAARRVAIGKFDTRIFLKNNDEIKELADAFNYMTDQIMTLFADLSGRKDQLSSIIASMQEGLLVCNKDGRIVTTNESFNAIFHYHQAEGRFYWEVLREPEFGELIRKVANEKKHRIEEIAIEDKTFLCSATLMGPRREVLVVFLNISDMKNLEKIKKDFVVNVSHELRTPLTAIKGFVESMEETSNDEHKRYVRIVKRHTDRLINIVQDLLVLSELEEKGLQLEVDDVNLAGLIQRVLKINEQKISEKNLTQKINLPDNIPTIRADAFKLEQVFMNLIDNAIKYTESGSLSVAMEQSQDKAIVKIADTGIGIPEEHTNRIFERFYVVDKSRSRRLGGTGLGLAIVKHILQLHKGTIDVESTLGIGTTFTVTLPMNR